jgi:hypothetical protein
MLRFKEANFSAGSLSNFCPEIFNAAIAMIALTSG